MERPVVRAHGQVTLPSALITVIGAAELAGRLRVKMPGEPGGPVLVSGIEAADVAREIERLSNGRIRHE